jgi:uncharacterized protein YqhQ
VIVAPGLLTQRLTTREPELGMVEVAVRSLQSVMEREQSTPVMGKVARETAGSRS